MKRLLYVLTVCVALCCGTLTAQEKPNFVGTWKLFEPAAPDQFTPSQIVVAQDESVITVTTVGQMGQFKTQYKLDGSVGPSPLDFNGTLIDRVTMAVEVTFPDFQNRGGPITAKAAYKKG